MPYSSAMRARLALGFLPALLALSAVRPAWAEERPVLVVDATGGAGALIAARLTRALVPDPTLRPGSAAVIAALSVPTPVDDAARITATATLAGARDRLARFSHGEAAALARAAQDAIAGDADRPSVRALLADLVFVEAMALAGDADLAAAGPALGLVHRLDPGRTLDPARYPPEVLEAFAKAAVPPTATGLVMVAAPGASEILIDGVVVGAEPLATQVAPGPHIVTARGDTIRGSGRRIEAAAGQTVRLDLISVLAPVGVRAARARDRLVAAATDGARVQALVALLELSGTTDAIVLIADGNGALSSRLYTARGGLGPARPVDDDLGAVLRPLRPIAPGPVKPPPGAGLGPFVPATPVPPWYEARWAKVSFGVGATAVVVAVVAALVTRDAGSSTFMPSIEVE